MKKLGVIEIPNGLDSEFDHAAFDPRTRRVFIAHTARDCIEVIDHDAQKHIATLPTGSSMRTMTGAGAHTTAIVVPDRLYVISPKHGGVLVLADE